MVDNRRAMPSYWIVAVLLLLWALMGDAAYLMQVTADLSVMAQTDPVSARIFAAMPPWVWSAYAWAVWLSTGGAVLLLLRRRAAIWLYAVSLVGIIVQFGWTFLMTDLIAQKGPSVMLFPMFIFIMGLFALWWSRSRSTAGLLR
jgi:hypothetical protein